MIILKIPQITIYYMDNIVAKDKHRGTEVQSLNYNVLIIKGMARRNCLQF